MKSTYHGSLHCFCLLLLVTPSTRSFTPFSQQANARKVWTSHQAVDVAAASLVAGSLAGAIGVGVAHPLDTLNIKTQVLQAATSLEKLNAKRKNTIAVFDDQQESNTYSHSQLTGSKTVNSSVAIDPVRLSSSAVLQATVLPSFSQKVQRQMNFSEQTEVAFVQHRVLHRGEDDGEGLSFEKVDTWQVMRHVYETEGVAGFLGGIRIMMMGQGLVKACSFTVNAVVLNWEVAHASSQTDSPTTAMFLIAAATAGFVSSFIVNPVERVKVLLQAASSSKAESELECVRSVLKSEGWTGFLGRGLGTTMLREVPSDAIYFSVYGLLMQAVGGGIGGSDETMMLAPWLASLLFGAASGVASWIPVYPVDLVKTLVQNTNGNSVDEAGSSTVARDTWQVVQDLYAAGGVGAFYNGITPKLLRAAVFHAVTFWVYDTIFPSIESTMSFFHVSAS
ncbi:solute carrier family 25 (mitochondrial carnitine/acylcarnitine transporter), member 20/29 [Fistulifera solaris]|uniref:Solute carrier family 25 (Mitochondrial carnitine/acylcarnitine transporter), member 20/29 n=1 Tax=Fistulifera solaris TaxID=1519565 RepID=A0A1Z5JRN6_FISSO|nr:solute carrier family 25 (mitochondrial carnitine/acylcarnitine transporter), member 20/29 [Fistulifera solaris]|eukprot:GAX16418.1 solute carrier family 25 (mitochondrial carnitine/acylcarnitine transporter), member 20/29 [Fistulifera solaris]